MNNILLEIKLKIKKIVTNSDFLSGIRRQFRFQKAQIRYHKMSAAYRASGLSKKISEYKDIHDGERCFIIGNGPSLKPEDLDLIKNEYSFASNRIYLMYEKTHWRPTYYMCQDRQLIRSLRDYYVSCKETVFLGYPALYEYGIYIPAANYYLADDRDATRIVNKLSFSDRADQFVYDGGSVTYSAIQLAVYMGFKQIYLLGVDHSFTHTLDKNRRIIEHDDVKEDYFDKRYKDAFNQFAEKGKVFAAPDKQLMDLAFSAALEYAESHNVQIINATRGGKLEIFTRVDFDDLIKK